MIEVENHSPFPHFQFEKSGYRGKQFDVLAIKGTFRLKTDGSRADLEDEQMPLVMADTYWGEAETSSLKFETDLVIAKRRTDVHVIGHAHTAAGNLKRQWVVGVRVGDLFKCMHITGPRYWEHRLLQWKLSGPQPASRVPLRYELAYGGQQREAADIEPLVYRTNPVGVGFLDRRRLDVGSHYAAPQFESPEPLKRINSIQACYLPEGFGPISRWWEPRVKYAGTYDEAWRKDTWPFLPDDFDFAFYNSATPDLQVNGYLQGDETVVLEGMLPEAETITTALVGYTPICVVEDDSATFHRLFPRLDTVTIDIDERLIYHTWRLTLPRAFAARHIVLGSIVPPCDKRRDPQRTPFERSQGRA